MDKLLEIEPTIKNPETIAESEQETLDRDRARFLWLNANDYQFGITEYEAGWKAAKAYYQKEAQ